MYSFDPNGCPRYFHNSRLAIANSPRGRYAFRQYALVARSHPLRSVNHGTLAVQGVALCIFSPRLTTSAHLFSCGAGQPLPEFTRADEERSAQQTHRKVKLVWTNRYAESSHVSGARCTSKFVETIADVKKRIKNPWETQRQPQNRTVAACTPQQRRTSASQHPVRLELCAELVALLLCGLHFPILHSENCRESCLKSLFHDSHRVMSSRAENGDNNNVLHHMSGQYSTTAY